MTGKEISPYPRLFHACMLGGAIGDAWGSAFENIEPENPNVFYYGGRRAESRAWMLTDDTMLTLATCEVLQQGRVTPKILGKKFVEYFDQNKLPGIGASTLQAIRDLKAGLHWSHVGRKGEFGAGNGAAMRIAPFAFFPSYGMTEIQDFCRITHQNGEAYVGALAVFLLLREILAKGAWNPLEWIRSVIWQLPDTNVRDRMMELEICHDNLTIQDLSAFGKDGYVVNSVPFAIFSALKVKEIGFTQVLEQMIQCGGDTDTNASIAGQIMGTIVGDEGLPQELLEKLAMVRNYQEIVQVLNGLSPLH